MCGCVGDYSVVLETVDLWEQALKGAGKCPRKTRWKRRWQAWSDSDTEGSRGNHAWDVHFVLWSLLCPAISCRHNPDVWVQGIRSEAPCFMIYAFTTIWCLHVSQIPTWKDFCVFSIVIYRECQFFMTIGFWTRIDKLCTCAVSHCTSQP